MAIGNLADKVSSSDMDAVRKKNNPSEFEEGFGDDMDEFSFDGGGSDGFDGFDSLDGGGNDGFDSFGGGNDGFDSFGGGNDGFDSFGGGNDGFDSFGGGNSGFDSFGGGNDGFGGFGNNGFGNNGFGNNQQAESKPDAMDTLMEAGGSAAKATWSMIVEMFKSVKSRNGDDWGMLSKNYIKIGIGVSILGVLLFVFGALSGLKALSLSRLPIHFMLAGMLTAATGFIGIGTAALKILKTGGVVGEYNTNTEEEEINDIEDDSGFFNGEEEEDTDEEFDSIMDEIFEDDEDSWEMEPEEEEEEEEEEEPEEVDLESLVANAPTDVRLIKRDFLYNLFKPMFPCNTPGFSDKNEIDPESEEFAQLETLCMKAMSQATKKEIEELSCSLEQALETKFCYLLKLTREKGKVNLNDIKTEMEAWFRSGVNDRSVSATVDIDGGFYSIIISKGESAVITFGDCFKLPEVEEFYLKEKNIMPIIAGIDELGNPILVDAKNYSTMLIAGKPRSGKSWYVDSLIISMVAFNTPEDVQLLIIDPKESYLFKTIALLPHVCGIHNHSDILNILKDIIDLEGARRKSILSANRCDDIWALRKKGIKLPVLYIVIDEFMTIIGDLGKQSDELTTLMNTIISQLPSQGIRLLFVPHRAQGVVGKTTRTLVDYIAAVRADNETVRETLGVKQFERNLSNPGDTALKLADHPDAEFVRGAAITTSDDENTELIMSMAKTFYKIGVDIPDMSVIGKGFNRDEEYIRSELDDNSTSKRVQYNLDDVSDIDLKIYEGK